MYSPPSAALRKTLATALTALCLTLSPALACADNAPGAQPTRELWTGKLYASSYRAGACLDPNGEVRGVLLLRVPSGKVDVYHFTGTNTDGRITARHSSGHVFEGQLNNDHEVTGVITLKSGFTIRLKGQRTQGVELTETCRPLPE